jgi:hypothetical protein
MMGVYFFYLASAYLTVCQMSPNSRTTQKPTTVPPHISVNNGRMGTFQVAILCSSTIGRHMSHMNEIFFIFRAEVPGEASETVVKLCLWALLYF